MELTPGGWAADDWQFAARFQSRREVDATGGLVAWSPLKTLDGASQAAELAARWERLRPALAPFDTPQAE